MSASLFGLEAELAISARKGGKAVPVTAAVEAFVEVAARELTFLRGDGSRMFLANGALLYIDAGMHPEVATAECTNPREAVCQLRGAERMVAQLAAHVCKEQDFDEVIVNRCNVDYVDSSATWGCHESYLVRKPVEYYRDWISPHLVSRIVYTGAGGLDPLSPGIRYSLSPRAAHITSASSENSTSNRGIFHSRDEALCKDYYRLHVLAGDNACSRLSTLLKVGTTALVVALAEKSTLPPLKLKDPVRSMQRFACDPGFRATVETRRGICRMSAFDIQRKYLDAVQAWANTNILPEWAGRICTAWRAALEACSCDGGRGVQDFDWTLKRDIMSREIERSGFNWKSVGTWSRVLEQLHRQCPDEDGCVIQIDMEKIERLRAEHPSLVRQLVKGRATLAAAGIDWDGLSAFNKLRQRLCVIDVRFGQIDDGLFDTLDGRGMLPGHRVVTDDDIGATTGYAPTGTRAQLRAKWVKELACDRDRYKCSWEGIVGETTFLDLRDPFATESEWKTRDAASDEEENELIRTVLRSGRGGSSPYATRTVAFELYRDGHYAQAEAMLSRLLASGFEPADIHCHLARVSLVTNNLVKARDHVAQAWALRDAAQPYVVARALWLHAAIAMAYPDTAIAPDADTGATVDTPRSLGKLKNVLQSGNAEMTWSMEPVLNHLESRITGDQHALLAALVAAMSDWNQRAALEALEAWRTQAVLPVDDERPAHHE